MGTQIITSSSSEVNGTSPHPGNDPLPLVPAQLKAIPLWNAWKYVPDPNRPKPRKIPHQSNNKWADTMQPHQWGPYDAAIARLSTGVFAGVGILLVAPIVGLDKDNCVKDNVISAEAWELILEADSYTEISPSGTGIRIFVSSSWAPSLDAPQGFNRGGIELYFGKRFLTVTGRHVEGTPTIVQDRTAFVRTKYEQLAGPQELVAMEGADIEPSPVPENFLDRLRKRNPRIADRIFSETTAMAAGADIVESMYEHHAARVDRSRNDLYIASWLLSHGGQPGQILTVLSHPTWFSGSKTQERGNDGYARRTIARAMDILADRKRELPDALKHLTELGNAETLIEEYGNNLRYCESKGGWLTWTGTCWLPDRTDVVPQNLQTIVRGLHTAASNASDVDTADRIRKWAYKSETHRVQTASIALARTLEGVKVSPELFDSQVWQFPAQNGVIDLQTGDLLPHNRDQYFTHLSTVSYHAGAKAPRWRKALEKWLPDPEVRTFIQRAMGYTLTGTTGEQVFFFLHGAGSNGKSTFILTMQGLLGAFCRRIATEAVTLQKTGSPGTLRDQAAARLIGARMGVVSEVERNARFAEGWLKDLTGGGVVATKILYENPSETLPTAKLWIDANHEPRAMPGAVDSEYADTDSFWRRLREIPFNVPVPVRERVLDFHRILLREEGPGILAWAVEGCLDWQKNGLPVPNEITEATDAYRRKEDTLRPFIEEWLVPDEKVKVTHKDTYEAYKLWASNNGESRVARRILREWLIERGFRTVHDAQRGDCWKGYRLSRIPDFRDMTAN